jgi:hypothetical protein
MPLPSAMAQEEKFRVGTKLDTMTSLFDRLFPAKPKKENNQKSDEVR